MTDDKIDSGVEKDVPPASPTAPTTVSETVPEDNAKTPVTEQEPAKEPEVDKTKAFAARLAQKAKQIREEERAQIAKDNGYGSYAEFVIATRNKKIREDTGYDPSEDNFKKLETIIKTDDPEKKALQEEVAALKETEAGYWESTQVALLNSQCGLKISHLTDLSQDVQDRIAKGIDPIDAYYLSEKPWTKQSAVSAPPVPKPQADDKSHLSPDPLSSSNESGKNTISALEIDICRQMNPEMSDEQIVEKMKEMQKE